MNQDFPASLAMIHLVPMKMRAWGAVVWFNARKETDVRKDFSIKIPHFPYIGPASVLKFNSKIISEKCHGRYRLQLH